MLTEDAARALIVSYGRSIFDRGLTPGRTGNLSVLVDSARVVSTPTGVSLGALDEEQLSLIELDGRHVSGPSSTKEAGLHLAFYHAGRGEAVVHLHSPFAMAYSCLDGLEVSQPIPPMTPYLVMRAPDLYLVPYHPPGSAELGEAVQRAVDRSAHLLLARHGLIVAGPTLADALDAAEEIEQASTIALQTLGRAQPLADNAVAELRSRLA